MTVEFQKNILKYLFHKKVDYINALDEELFSEHRHLNLFKILKQYITNYHMLPSEVAIRNIIEGLENIPTEIKEEYLNELVFLYGPLTDARYIGDVILTEVKKTMFVNIMSETMESMEKGIKVEHIDQLHKKLSRISYLDTDISQGGLYAIRDMANVSQSAPLIYPHFIQGINDMTALGGFYAPQLQILLGGPKGYKTGFLIATAVEHIRMGGNVYYADFENGEYSIGKRIQQYLLKCELHEIRNFNDDLYKIRDKFMGLIGGGDIYIKKYKKKKEHFGHIDNDIERRIDEGFEPNLIVVDYIDVMGCHEKVSDKRLAIQANYAYADTINNKYNTHMWSVSKMKQEAYKKEFPGPEDVMEDSEKVYNAHGVWALVRSPEDIVEGIGKITSVMQREGDSLLKTFVPLRIDPKLGIFEELVI